MKTWQSIGFLLLRLAVIIGGVLLLYQSAQPPVRTLVGAKVTDTRAPETEVPLVDNPSKVEPERDT